MEWKDLALSRDSSVEVFSWKLFMLGGPLCLLLTLIGVLNS
jgi:hypothetical protein